ncbi:MAG: (2Fe-2S)-binding protein [Acidobacteriota bacterium]
MRQQHNIRLAYEIGVHHRAALEHVEPSTRELIDGRSVKSCTQLAVQADGASVTTIEGLRADDGSLHPLQEAFREHHGLQCGYCTPGMIMTAAGSLQDNPNPSRDEIRQGLKGNVCRCTGYHNIVEAIADAADKMHGGDA